MGKTLILCSGSINDLGLFDDIKDDDRFIFCLAYTKCYSNRVIEFFKRIHLNEKMKLPFKYIWHSYYSCLKRISEVDRIIVMNGALQFTDIAFLRRCKRKNKKLKIYLYLIDAFDAESPAMAKAKKKMGLFEWDKIYSYDPYDCGKYGFMYIPFGCYSRKHGVTEDTNSDIRSDVFFAGGIKGNRTQQIFDCYTKMTSEGVKCDFIISTYGKVIDNVPDGMECNTNFISYDEVLKRTLQSRCIIEILQEAQHSPSLRYCEALFYNKKLITTNPLTVNYPFYDSRYMKIIKSAEDIDAEWVRNDDMPDYGYTDEFSPKHLLEKL